jgi:hypothetical protein
MKPFAHLKIRLAAVLAMLAVLAAPLGLTVQANAFMYPAVDASSLCIQSYTQGNSNVPVYASQSLSGRIGAVYPSDRFTIVAASGQALKIQYPTAGGTKSGWIASSAVSNGNLNGSCSLAIQAGGAVPLYRRAEGSATIGSVSQNDVCYLCFAQENHFTGRVQLIVPVSGGWKLGWAAYADLDASEWRACGGGETIRSGQYRVFTAPGYVIDGNGPDDDVHVWENLSDVSAQVLNIQYCGGGVYSVEFGHKSGWCMDVCSASTQAANVHAWPSNGTDAQRWFIADLGQGRYAFFAKCGGLALDVDNFQTSSCGAEISTWRYHGQSFTLQRLDGGTVSCSGQDASAPDTSAASTLTEALFGVQTSQSFVTCPYDGYVNTSGRHEGVDLSYHTGAAVYSPVDATVIRKTNGYNGSGGLSTIALYVESANMTVIVLHTAPDAGLSVGSHVSRGEQIATQAWRGVSSASASHVHVEVRPGRVTSAAKSVGDPVLSNPDPTPFWQSQGLAVR